MQRLQVPASRGLLDTADRLLGRRLNWRMPQILGSVAATDGQFLAHFSQPPGQAQGRPQHVIDARLPAIA